MSVSVIVPVYNGAMEIGACLDGLAAQQPWDPTLEIIVVNDGSTDSTVQAVEQWKDAHPQVNVRLVSQANAWQAAARNHGARLAFGDLLLMTDADCIPSPGWVEAFRGVFEGSEAPDAAMGAYTCAQTSPAARFAQLEFEERYALMARRQTIDFIATYSAAYRRQVFLEAGGFDSAIPNNEDAEFAYRLHTMGKRILFVPTARVQHEHDATWVRYLKTKIGRGYWRTMVYRRFPGKGLKDSYTPQVMKAQMPLALVALNALLAALITRSPRKLLGALPFAASTLPMIRLAAAHPDPAVRSATVWVPWGSLIRAVAFAIGVAQALLAREGVTSARHGALSAEPSAVTAARSGMEGTS